MNRLREERMRRNMSQLKLYLETGVAPCIISWIENGRWNPTKEQQLKLATALGLDVGLLFPEKHKK